MKKLCFKLLVERVEFESLKKRIDKGKSIENI